MDGAGDHTFNGRPILANDSHARMQSPNVMYLTHLNTAAAGGELDVMGMGFLGVPGVQVGQTRHIRWGATTNFADQTDLWGVAISPEGTIDWGGQTRELTTRTEEYRVKTQAGGFETRSFEVRELEGVGVILSEALLPLPKALLGVRGDLLLGCSCFSPTRELTMYLALNEARDLEDFEDAIGIQREGMQTWHAASASGIRLKANGSVPDRGSLEARAPAHVIMIGSNPEHVWTGEVLPAEQLPRLDEARDFHVSANNDPWGHTADGDPLNDAFYYGAFYSPGVRAGRVQDVLRGQIEAGGGITVEQTEALQLDVRSTFAPRLLPELFEAWGDVGSYDVLVPYVGDTGLAQAVEALRDWDGDMDADSYAALVYKLWSVRLTRNVVGDELGFLFDPIDSEKPATTIKYMLLAFERDDDALLDDDRRVLVLEALREALALITDRGLSVLGDLHQTRYIALDESREYEPRSGGDSTVNVAESRCWSDGEFSQRCEAPSGAVYRTITTFREDGWPETRFNWPRGNAGEPRDWDEGVYRRWWFAPGEVEAHTVSEYTIEPRL